MLTCTSPNCVRWKVGDSGFCATAPPLYWPNRCHKWSTNDQESVEENRSDTALQTHDWRECTRQCGGKKKKKTHNTGRHTCDVVGLFLFYKKLSKRPVSPRLDYINALSVLGLSARFCFPVPVLFFFVSFFLLNLAKEFGPREIYHIPDVFRPSVPESCRAKRAVLCFRSGLFCRKPRPSSSRCSRKQHSRARTVTGELKQLESDDARETMAMYR